MGDRLYAIEELVKARFANGSEDRKLFLLILEELHHLRDQNQHQKNAVEEFARKMP